jgi:outer membrane protein
MKKLTLFLSIAAMTAFVACTNNSTANGGTSAAEASESGAKSGAIVYFSMDRVLSEYDMANDLRSVVETKVGSINQEVTRRGNKLEKDIKAFQDKINKGLLTQSVAETQSQKLSQQQNDFQTYAAQKQQEIAEEQQVMMNQIADAINSYIKEFNADKGYAMILTTQGDILPMPVVTADESLDITDELLEGLNAAYVKTKGQKAE